VRTVAAREFRRDDSAGAEVAIFHAFVPEEPPSVNALYSYPPSGNGFLRSARDVVDAQILDWNDADPILHDLRYVEALPLDRARLLELPPWAHTLIASRAEGREFPLAFAGETAGRRVVCFGFDLGGRSLAKSENLSLLLVMLNALRWLTPPDGTSPVQVDVGETYRETLPAPAPISLVAADGRTETFPAKGQLSIELARAGEYRVTAGQVTRTLYANVFDADESDIGRSASAAEEVFEGGPSGGGAPVVKAAFLHELARALLLAGFLLALAEWLTWSWLGRIWRAAKDV
jgi:hypothetical protein